MAQDRGLGVTLVLTIALCLSHSVAEGREASRIGGFSLNMSSDEIASIARSRLRLKVIHSDESLDLYNQGDDPDRSVPLAYFSYGRNGEIGCMHFQIGIFKVENIFTRDLLRILQTLYGVERFRERKLLGYPVFFHGHTKFGEHVSILSSSKTKPSWMIFCSADQNG
jgi:hypothetical protein